MPLTSLPLLVRFRDLNDPLTVEKVDPLNLEASFGPGVKLTRATMEIVSAGLWPMSEVGIMSKPITTEMERRLTWLRRLQSNIDGTSATSSNRLSNTLHVGNFVRR